MISLCCSIRVQVLHTELSSLISRFECLLEDYMWRNGSHGAFLCTTKHYLRDPYPVGMQWNLYQSACTPTFYRHTGMYSILIGQEASSIMTFLRQVSPQNNMHIWNPDVKSYQWIDSEGSVGGWSFGGVRKFWKGTPECFRAASRRNYFNYNFEILSSSPVDWHPYWGKL